MMKSAKLKRMTCVLIMACLAMSIYATVTPTVGFRVSADGGYITGNEIESLGYGIRGTAYLGADINRWSNFFGEFGIGFTNGQLDLSTFGGFKGPWGMDLGAGWGLSPGAGWTLSLSSGLSLLNVSNQPNTWEAGFYVSFVPRWITGKISEFYCPAISFPIQFTYTHNTAYLTVGVAIGAETSIYEMRRGNAFTGVDY